MGLEKAIKYGKEFRKEYRGSKSFDYSCRNHGGGRTSKPCPICEENRLHASKIRLQKSNYQIEEFEQEENKLSKHAQERMVERHFSKELVDKIIKEGEKYLMIEHKTMEHVLIIGRTLYKVVTGYDGGVITMYERKLHHKIAEKDDNSTARKKLIMKKIKNEKYINRYENKE